MIKQTMLAVILSCTGLFGINTPITSAEAIIEAKSGSAISGKVTFKQEPSGVRIVADVKGLKPGLHGFHIHEKGDCSAADASSAGGHYNPHNKPHGGPNSPERHVGDFGNLVANGAGEAHYDEISDLVELNGEYSIIGKSVVIHADPDDLKTQPTGNSGVRIGCGEIKAK